MKVLVTGGAGFIGSHTVDLLLARGHLVRVLDSLRPPVHRGGAQGLPTDVDVRIGDVEDPAALRSSLEGVDAVFHLAAYQDYLPDFSQFFRTNSVATALLYELIVRDRLPIQRVVVASSQSVYGEGRYRCQRHGLFYPEPRSAEALAAGRWDLTCPIDGCAAEPDLVDESFARPHTSYGLSKRDQEDIGLLLGARYGIPTVALRYSIVQGPGQSFKNAYSGALRSFAVRLLNGAPAVIYEDGLQRRDYVSVHDAVAANLLALERAEMSGRVYNVGGDRSVTVRELERLVARAAGRDLDPEMSGLYRVGDTRHILSDVSRLRALGWAPQWDQPSIVREYLEWAAAQPDLSDTFAEAAARMRRLGVLRRASTSDAN